jgi:hypothetical protein
MMMKALNEGNIRCWALIASVAVHSAALAFFTGVKLSDHSSPASTPPPALSISIQTIERIVQQPQPHPKPQIEPIQPPQPEPSPQPRLLAAPQPVQSLPTPEPLEPIKPESVWQPDSVSSEIRPEAVWQPAPAVNEVEFFGQKSIVQRVCYVVDCSGSMYGRMYQVRQQLKESILKLNSQQAFAVVFFMDGRNIMTSGDGKLVPATAGAKSQALALIESIRPAGSTDAANALDRAMRLKDPSGNGPELIYFLTDGFDLDSQHSMHFSDNAQRLKNSLAPGAVLHTIGFCPESRDRQMLRQLAAETGGEFIEVK